MSETQNAPFNFAHLEELNDQPVTNSTNLGQQIFKWVTKGGKTAIMITEVIVILVFLSRVKLDRDLFAIEQNIALNAKALNSTEDTALYLQNTKYKIDKIKEIDSNKFMWDSYLNFITAKVPGDMNIETLNIQSGNISIKAQTKTALAFAQFVHLLIESTDVDSITLIDSRYIKDSETYTFSMEINMGDIKNGTK